MYNLLQGNMDSERDVFLLTWFLICSLCANPFAFPPTTPRPVLHHLVRNPERYRHRCPLHQQWHHRLNYPHVPCVTLVANKNNLLAINQL